MRIFPKSLSLEWFKCAGFLAAFIENDSTLRTAPCRLDTAPCADGILTHFCPHSDKIRGESFGWTRGRADLDTAPCLEAVFKEFFEFQGSFPDRVVPY